MHGGGKIIQLSKYRKQFNPFDGKDEKELDEVRKKAITTLEVIQCVLEERIASLGELIKILEQAEGNPNLEKILHEVFQSMDEMM